MDGGLKCPIVPMKAGTRPTTKLPMRRLLMLLLKRMRGGGWLELRLFGSERSVLVISLGRMCEEGEVHSRS